MVAFLALFLNLPLAMAGVERPLTVTPATQMKHKCTGYDLYQAIDLRDKKCLSRSLGRMDVNEKDLNGDTPIHRAIRRRFASAILLLLEKGADLSYKNNQLQTPKQLAADLGYANLVYYFDNIELETKRLLEAVEANDVAAARSSLKRGASLGTTDVRLDTPLHRAVQSGFTDMARLLIKAGARVDARNYLGETPLHAAAMRDFTPTMELLLRSGANPNAVNERRETPLDLIQGRGDPAAMALLRKYKATNGTRADVSFEISRPARDPEPDIK